MSTSPSTPRFGASLQFRLPLIYTSILLIVLLVTGVTQYEALKHNLVNARASTLSSDVEQSRVLLDRYLHISSVARDDLRMACTTPTLAEGLDGSFAKFIASTSGTGVGVVIYSSAGAVVTIEPQGAVVPQLSAHNLTTLLSGGTIQPQILTTSSGTDLVIGEPIAPKSPSKCGIVEMSTSMNSVYADLHKLLLEDVIEEGIAFVLAGVLGIYITRRALAPLEKVTSVAAELAGGNLRARSHLPSKGDEVSIVAVAVDDMADRIEEAFLAQRESELRAKRFIADASHELRTPVTALKGYIEVLKRGAARDPVVLDAALVTMGEEAERMRKLVIDLLMLARLDSSAPSVSMTVFEVNTVLNELLDLGVPGMPQVLERNFTTVPLYVNGDPEAFKTIFRNLLTNGCAYAKGARQVWSTTTSDAKTVIIQVHDDGPGIPQADLPHIFERFYRGEKTRTREEGGSGLGLSIVAGQVGSQGGTIAVESAEGFGTTFTVKFLRVEPPSIVG